MKSSSIEDVTRLVVQAVKDRLGSHDPDVVEVVTREVVSAMAGVNAVPAPSTPAPPSAAPASDNGDGTLTTGLGAVLPTPAGAGVSAELCAGCIEQVRREQHNRAVVTTTGRNAKGVVARVAAVVADPGGDIQDISQTIIGDFFTMIMVVDITDLAVPFAEFRERVLAAASELGIQAMVMHEEVMLSLQRV